MRTSLLNVKQIDDHLHGQLEPQEATLFAARLLIDDELADKVYWHKQALTMINNYGRNNLLSVIETVHHQLFTQPAHQSFKQKVLQLFK